jgi:hypothetical protein
MFTEATVREFKFSTVTKDPTAPDPSKSRFGEPAKFLPVAFVLSVVFSLWIIYVTGHCLPLMQHPETYALGWTHLVVFNILGMLLLSSYGRSMLQHPGTIPDAISTEEGQISWEYAPADGRAISKEAPSLEKSLKESKERKRLGERRTCKWCNKYKPDRCHHCRVCRMCVLKMDHHCPWIYNCVGQKNFKYFFLLVLYAAICSNMITWTMLSTVRKMTYNSYTPFLSMFIVLFGESLAGLMALLLTAFLAFHIQLMVRAMTTIEFCEKSRRPNFDTDVYSQGVFANIQAALGDNVFLWFLPICAPTGDGLMFKNDDGSPLVLKSPRDDGYGAVGASQNKVQNNGGTGEAPVATDDEEGGLPGYVPQQSQVGS